MITTNRFNYWVNNKRMRYKKVVPITEKYSESITRSWSIQHGFQGFYRCLHRRFSPGKNILLVQPMSTHCKQILGNSCIWFYSWSSFEPLGVNTNQTRVFHRSDRNLQSDYNQSLAAYHAPDVQPFKSIFGLFKKTIAMVLHMPLLRPHIIIFSVPLFLFSLHRYLN